MLPTTGHLAARIDSLTEIVGELLDQQPPSDAALHRSAAAVEQLTAAVEQHHENVISLVEALEARIERLETPDTTPPPRTPK